MMPIVAAHRIVNKDVSKILTASIYATYGDFGMEGACYLFFGEIFDCLIYKPETIGNHGTFVTFKKVPGLFYYLIVRRSNCLPRGYNFFLLPRSPYYFNFALPSSI